MDTKNRVAWKLVESIRLLVCGRYFALMDRRELRKYGSEQQKKQQQEEEEEDGGGEPHATWWERIAGRIATGMDAMVVFGNQSVSSCYILEHMHCLADAGFAYKAAYTCTVLY